MPIALQAIDVWLMCRKCKRHTAITEKTESARQWVEMNKEEVEDGKA